MNVNELYPILEDSASPNFSETRMETLHRVIEARAERERELTFRHPMVPVIVNWAVVFMAIALVISLVVWGIDATIRHRASEMTAQAMADREQQEQAEQQAEQERLKALAQTKEATIKSQATDCAKALYGINKFIDKYHYTENDLRTYLRCAFNRVDARGIPLDEVLYEKDQFLACNQSNPVLTDFYDIAKAAVTDWHNEESKPCDLSYQFAELTPNGIYLKADLHADGYARRWWYQ